ncbi:MAG TPA: hypothetical protein VF041_21765 [Gemmatimonadaceae bacterium]
MPDVGAEAVAARYAERAAEHAAQEGRCRARGDRLGWARIVCFLVALGALAALARSTGGRTTIAAVVLLAAAAVFVVLVIRHGRLRESLLRHEQSRLYYEIGALRIARDWSALPPSVTIAPVDHSYAEDLDVVGHASLARLLDTAGTGRTNQLLLSWLLTDPAPAHVVRARQGAVRELMEHDELREELGVLTRLAAPAGAGAGASAVERLVAWSTRPVELRSHPLFLGAVRIATAITVLLLFLQLAGLVRAPWWMLSATAGTLLLAVGRRLVRGAVPPIELRAAAFRRRVEMLALLERQSFRGDLLGAIHRRLSWGGGASEALASLGRIVAWSEVRHSPMLHAVLQWLFQWDAHLGARAEGWRKERGALVSDWLDALEEVGALAALATIASENPEWAFADIEEGGEPAPPAAPAGVDARRAGSAAVPGARAVIEALSLGHPLLPDAVRVANDVTVGPPGSFLLVTGSNMSGKSTLLRAIGANVLLAQAGGAACAARLRIPLVNVRTSIRVSDSLESGVSLFMAELRRLETIVRAARERAGGRPLLYLLDEMLHGTNTAERRVAARIVIGHLLAAGAIGAVTTHDLTLAAEGPLAEASRPVHFTEHFERVNGVMRMSFDYRLRPGLATSTNALALLEMVGLGEAPGEP